MKWSLKDDLLILEGNNSFLLTGRAENSFLLYIETFQDETSQSVQEDDLVVVSCPEGGGIEPAAMLLELVRRYHTPLVVLPKNHPGSSRLKMVVAVSREILTSCTIRRGTHPEQHLLCSSEELTGIHLKGEAGNVIADNIPKGVSIRSLPPFHWQLHYK